MREKQGLPEHGRVPGLVLTELPAGDGKTHGGSKYLYPLHNIPIISLFLMALTFLTSLQLAPHPKPSLTCCVPFHPASQPPHTSSAALCALTAPSCHVFELLMEAQSFCKPFGGLQLCAWPSSSMPHFSKALVWQQRARCWHPKHPIVTLSVSVDLQIFPRPAAGLILILINSLLEDPFHAAKH